MASVDFWKKLPDPDSSFETGLTRSSWIPAGVGIGIVCATLVVWQAFTRIEAQHLQTELQLRAESIKKEFLGRLRPPTRALSRMVKRWETGGLPPKEIWETEARQYLDHFPAGVGLAWIDSSRDLPWQVFSNPKSPDNPRDFFDAAAQKRSLEEARRRKNLVVSPAVEIRPGQKGFVVYAPRVREGRVEGILAGKFLLDPLFSPILKNDWRQGLSVDLFEGDRKVFQRGGPAFREAVAEYRLPLEFFDRPWEMRIQADASVLAFQNSFLNEAVLAAGTLLGLLLAAIVRLSQKTRLRAEQIERVNRDLETEIAERKRAEEGLEIYWSHLEHLVQIRTGDLETANAELNREVSQRKRMERQLKVSLQELERSNRDLNEFASITSHDLQEPLRKIITFGDRLNQCADRLDDRSRGYLERMQQAAERMQEFIDDLLIYSRVATKARPFQPTDLEPLVQDITADLEVRLAQTRGQVQTQDLPTVEGDSFQLRQLLYNLIVNALKYHRPEVPPEIRVCGGTDGNGNWEIRVEDNGIGFKEEYAERIFQPFERLHSRQAFEGTGMGLAICQKIVKRHGGTIAVRSQPEKGSTFIIALPCHPASGERQTSPDPSA